MAGATSELVENHGLQSKSWRRRYTRWGYEADFWFVRGHKTRRGSLTVRKGDGGLPAALTWAFVDDFMIHAPTWEKLIWALNAFMDLSLRLGFIC